VSDAAGSTLLDPRAARRALQNARGKQKLDLILSAPDPEQLVASLPPEELYFALLDIGPDDAAELVAMASPEQFRHFVDMSAWRGADEGPRTSEVIRWLRLAREGGADLAKFRRQLWSLDIELLALVLRRELSVHDLTEEEPPPPRNPGMAYYTSDRRFLLEFAGSAEHAAVRQLIEDLYAQDPFGAGRLIESIRWELPIELEESARRWRDGRLRDAGVPEFEEAVAFYARPAQRAREPTEGPPTQALTAPSGPLLDAALERLDGDRLEIAEEAIVYAANAALVANRVPLDDAAEVREQLANARATLSLGLELLSGADAARAAQILVDEPIRSVFQAAMGEAYRLQARARKIAARARLPQAQTATVLDEPLESALQALLRARPMFHQPGQRRPRAFASPAEIAQAEALLDEAEATIALLSTMGIPPAQLGPKAEEAGLGPAVVKASLAVRALISSQARGEPFSLRGETDESREKPPGFYEKLDQLLRSSVHDEVERRAADRLKTLIG
jgi:Family of unknown function (DUF6178)